MTTTNKCNCDCEPKCCTKENCDGVDCCCKEKKEKELKSVEFKPDFDLTIH